MNPADYCLARAAPDGSGLHYALLFHTPAERRALAACFAFLDAIRGSAPTRTDTTPTLRRLAWWQEELSPARSPMSVHPVLAELRELDADPADLQRMLVPCIGAVMRELSGWQPRTAEEWFAHGLEAGAGAWQLAARHCGAGPEALPGIGCVAGRHHQLLQLLDLAPRLALGRCDLPRELLARSGWTGAVPDAGRPAPGADTAIRDCAALLHEGFLEAAANPDRLRALPRFCRVLVRIDIALCARILSRPGRLFSERVALWPLHKLWLAWRERG